MKKLRISLAMLLAVAVAMSAFAMTASAAAVQLVSGYYGNDLDYATSAELVADGALKVVQNADQVYRYVDTGNLLQNPGFETSAATRAVGYGSIITEGWFANTSFGATSGKTTSIVTDASEAHSGTNAFAITLGEGSATGGILSNRIATAATVSERAYTTTGLEAGTTYVVSFWTKGDAQTSIRYRTALSAAASWTKSAYYADAETQESWELVYQEITAEEVEGYDGVIDWTVGINTANATAKIDDVQLVTKAQAIANVEAMIEALDITSENAARAIADIKQWSEKLGSESLSNYADFETKKAAFEEGNAYTYTDDNNVLSNPGFEESDAVTNTSGKAWDEAVITSGWTTNYSNSSKYTYSISSDSHSGQNALRLDLAAVSDTTRLSNRNNLITDAALVGRTGELSANTTYVVSYWVKGSATTQLWGRTISDSNTNSFTEARSADVVNPGDTWTLVTNELTANANGQIWWNVFFKANADAATVAVIDDVQLVTKAQAIANVEALIEAYDPQADFAARAAADIEQWCAKLGAENISNYAAFVGKNNGYVYADSGNTLLNPGFEASTAASNIGAGWRSLTEGWTASDAVSSAKFTLSLSDDAHSGNTAFRIESLSTNDIRMFNGLADSADATLAGATSTGEAGATYLVSYWVKGTASTRVFAKSGDDLKTNNWGTSITPSSTEWTLVTHTITSNSSGKVWWNLFFQGSQSGKYALIDDVQIVTPAQAIANVEAMIEAYDPQADFAARVAADIEQWCAKLGAENISNYAAFVGKNNGYVYLDNGNTLLNPGFEASTAAANISSGWRNLTEGWTSNDTVSSARYRLAISDDAHSGQKAFRIELLDQYGVRLFNGLADPESSPIAGNIAAGEADARYLVSCWVKGTAKVRVMTRAEGTSGGAAYSAVVTPSEDEWTLITSTIRSDSNGDVWWNIFLPDGTAGEYALIDDVQIGTSAQAIANVEAMIEALDITAASAERAIADIEQWCAALGSANLSNYSTFAKKSARYTALQNGTSQSITPNTGYTGLDAGSYVASVSLKGQGSVKVLHGSSESVVVLTDEWVTYSYAVAVGEAGTSNLGVQLTDTDAVEAVYVNSFAFNKLGDANADGNVDICDLVRVQRYLSGQSVSLSAAADTDLSGTVTDTNLSAIRRIILGVSS